MQYFVTGATGFIGKRLVKALLARRGSTVHFLLRPESEDKLAALLDYWGVGTRRRARAVPVFGDLTAKKLGVAADDIKALKGQIDHFYHLAAVYDLSADEETQVRSTSKARAHVSSSPRRSTPATCTTSARSPPRACTKACSARTCSTRPRASTIPYFMTKHESEKIVRKECKVPWTVYRPAMVVGDSQTGEMDKIDGPTTSSS